MTSILSKRRLSEEVYRLEVEAPLVARERKAGQFVIVQADENFGERIPLTIADADAARGTVTLVFQTVGASTHALAAKEPGDRIVLLGPLGNPTHIEKFGRAVCVGGGIGLAPLYPIVRALKAAGNEVIVIAGARTADLLVMQDELRAVADELIVVTDDGSTGRKALVTEPLKELCAVEATGAAGAGAKPDIVVAIGPPIMMKFCAETTRPFGVKTLVSLNTIMIDGTGMCGGCRVTVGGETKFACVDGPEFDGHLVDWDQMMSRLRAYKRQEEDAHHKCHLAEEEAKLAKADTTAATIVANATTVASATTVARGGRPMNDATREMSKEALERLAGEELLRIKAIRSEGRDLSPRERLALPSQEMPCQDSAERAHNMAEVAEGYGEAQARLEAERCINCKNARCVDWLPGPRRHTRLHLADRARATSPPPPASSSRRTSAPICGRVCPQESSASATASGQVVSRDRWSIGRLERWWPTASAPDGAGDIPDCRLGERSSASRSWARARRASRPRDLRREGHEVAVSTRPSEDWRCDRSTAFRNSDCPRAWSRRSPSSSRRWASRYELDFLVGQHEEARCADRRGRLRRGLHRRGRGAAQVHGDAGREPRRRLLGQRVPHEGQPHGGLRSAACGTPIKRSAAAWRCSAAATSRWTRPAWPSAWAPRKCGYSTGARGPRCLLAPRKSGMPMEEGVIFDFLTSPTRVIGDKNGVAEGLEILSYALGEPDASGRRSPVPVKGSERIEAFDTIIVAIGNESNPLLARTSPDLKVDKRGHILVDGKQKTSIDRVYAGGDIVLGAATVILAMGEGRRAAAAINELLA